MKFAAFTAPNGQAVYVNEFCILSPSIEHPGGTTIRHQAGPQEVKQPPADVAHALGSLDAAP